ncbi:plasmid pRiA4b ORF-3 family protein [Methyloprofundus sp.]|uniref:plasmid pRiA4b ORF-3 family protein n=1 Tax=Methyloprofundus sp. TaxID=2020875 RepID=UPI003D11A07F
MAITLRSTYQLKISLEGSKPPIWRRLLVASDIKLDVFHLALQITMGWTNSHLHQFISRDRKLYGIKDDDFEFDNLEIQDETATRLSQLLKVEKDDLIYEYDFGDGWTHKIILEKILAFDPDKKLPYCATGKRACPPEDCGGIWGYTDLLAIMENPEHVEYEDMIEWLGDEFDPAYLRRREINQLLLEYCR